ncbi:MAG: 50S ribosomal protein L22 [Patescibacteria group bacterium]
MNTMRAHARYIRQSPRKVRLVANLIRGLAVPAALAQLSQVTKAARRPVEKTLLSAVANAENGFQKSRDALFIKEIRIDEGPDYRRWRPRAFGRAAPILKHSCHIYLALEERPGTTSKQVSAPKTAETHESAPADEKVSSAITEGIPFDIDAPVDITQLPPEDAFDKTRKGRHETAQSANVKEKKKSKGFIKNIIQRKTG